MLDEEVAGSIPVTPTNLKLQLWSFSIIRFKLKTGPPIGIEQHGTGMVHSDHSAHPRHWVKIFFHLILKKYSNKSDSFRYWRCDVFLLPRIYTKRVSRMNAELLISKNIINVLYSNYSRTMMGVPEYTDRAIQLKQDLNTIGIGFIYDF